MAKKKTTPAETNEQQQPQQQPQQAPAPVPAAPVTDHRVKRFL